MKINEQQAAQTLFFQAGMSKAEIAENLGLSRTTVYTWAQQGNWDALKKSAEAMPLFLVENCYHILGDMQRHLLSPERIGKPATLPEINAMHKLTLTIGKLKTKNTVNENMELFTLFSEQIIATDPELAFRLQPHIREFITTQSRQNPMQPLAPAPVSPTDLEEARLDQQDIARWAQEAEAAATKPAAARAQSSAPAPSPALNFAPSPALNSAAAKSVADVMKPKKSFTENFREHMRNVNKAKMDKRTVAA